MDFKNNMLNKSVIASSAIVVLLSMSATASAHQGGFATDGTGRILKDGMGRCVTAVHGNSFAGKCGDIVVAQAIMKPPAPVVIVPPAPPVVVAAVKPKPKVVIIPKPQPRYITKTLSLNEAGGANFAFDSHNLSDKAQTQLATFADSVKASNVNPSSVSIVGHTDSIGSEKYNQKLSVNRANSVASYLSSQGINKGTMQVSGRGELQPIASNKSKAGRAQNRRVDIRVTGQRKVTIKQ